MTAQVSFSDGPSVLFLAEEPQCGHSGSVSCSPRSVVCDHTIDESLHLHGPRDSRKRCSKRPLSTCLFLADAGGNLNPELTRPAVNRKYVFLKKIDFEITLLENGCGKSVLLERIENHSRCPAGVFFQQARVEIETQVTGSSSLSCRFCCPS